MNTLTIRFGSTGLVVYLGLGILYHLISSDIPFTWADPWLYITMAIWPVFLLGWFLLAFAICFCLFVGFMYYEEHTKRKLYKGIRSRKRYKDWEKREERRRAAAKATPSDND